MNNVEGKVALVTGAASGIGAETARSLVGGGARVVLSDVDYDRLRTVAQELGDWAVTAELDVTSEIQWLEALGVAEASFGPIDVLVNSAGVASYGSLEEITEREYRRVIDVNQMGTFLGIKSSVPSMRRAGSGSVINVSSVAGLVGMAGASAYTSSKWAVRGLTKAAAGELGAHNIRVNSVHPGVIDTPILGPVRGIVDQLMPPNLAFGRVGQPSEVAGLIVFLASDQSTYITGAEFAVDGGWSAS